jgi:hypothetical protein
MWDNQGVSEEDLSVVQEIDALQPSAKNTERLWELAESDHLLVAHRSLERLKEVSSLAEANRIHNWIKDAKKPEDKRMRALDVLAAWLRHERQAMGESFLYQQGIEILGDCFFDSNPFFSKGTVVGLGIAGGHVALDVLFTLAVSPAGRVVRPEIFEEAIRVAGFGLCDFPMYIEKNKKEDFRLNIYLRDFKIEALASGKFTVYPSNDYMALVVRAHDINYKRFKYLVGER